MKKSITGLIAFFLAAALVVSTFLFWQDKNVEFIYYNILFFCFLLFFVVSGKRLHLGVSVIVGLLLLVVMHLLGGLVVINNVRLYDFVFVILPFDKIHHFVIGIVFSLLAAGIFSDARSWRYDKPVLFFLFVAFVSLGFGAFIEIMEFLGVQFLHSPGVGDYFNNATDLIADLLGAMAGAVIMLLVKNGKNLR